MSKIPGSAEFKGTGPWLTVVNPDVFMTWCAQCGEKFRKGQQRAADRGRLWLHVRPAPGTR